MDTPYTSNHLCHFVGWHTPDDDEHNWNTLCAILEDKCVSHPPHVKGPGIRGYTLDLTKPLFSGELVVPYITCFGDIPEGSLGLHVSKYGHFGLTFHRTFLIHEGARPVTYVPMASDDWQGGLNGMNLLRDIEAIFKGFERYRRSTLTETGEAPGRKMQHEPEGQVEVLRALSSLLTTDFLAYIKPFHSGLPPEDRRSFYMEREWRKPANLCFEFENVVEVWVASGYAARCRERFPLLSKKVKEVPPRPLPPNTTTQPHVC